MAHAHRKGFHTDSVANGRQLVAGCEDLCAKLTTNMSRKQRRDWASPHIRYIKICEDLQIPAYPAVLRFDNGCARPRFLP